MRREIEPVLSTVTLSYPRKYSIVSVDFSMTFLNGGIYKKFEVLSLDVILLGQWSCDTIHWEHKEKALQKLSKNHTMISWNLGF